jgi:hypothetical protein
VSGICASVELAIIFMVHFVDGADKGIIPLTCNELFERLATKTAADQNLSFTVEVSYIEVRYSGLFLGLALTSTGRSDLQ